MRGLTYRCSNWERRSEWLLDRTGQNQLTARANIVTCPIDECMGPRSTQGRHAGPWMCHETGPQHAGQRKRWGSGAIGVLLSEDDKGR